MRERVIAEYHDLLMNDESLTPELFARLKGVMSAMRLLYGIFPSYCGNSPTS